MLDPKLNALIKEAKQTSMEIRSNFIETSVVVVVRIAGYTGKYLELSVILN